MSQRWSPLRAALVVFGVVVMVGCVAAVVAASAIGTIHDQPYARGEKIGTGVGTLAMIAAGIAYVVQAKRVGRR